MDRTTTSPPPRNDGPTTNNANGPQLVRRVSWLLTPRFPAETVVAHRAKRDPAFKTALLQEALQAFLDGEVAPGLILLRDCINATIGFAAP